MITKRQLGTALALLGALTLIGLMINDWIGMSEYDGIGFLQRNLMIGGACLLFIGLTIRPMGEQPA